MVFLGRPLAADRHINVAAGKPVILVPGAVSGAGGALTLITRYSRTLGYLSFFCRSAQSFDIFKRRRSTRTASFRCKFGSMVFKLKLKVIARGEGTRSKINQNLNNQV